MENVKNERLGVVSTTEREIVDLKQAESFLLQHGLNSLTLIPKPGYRKSLNWIARVWWRVRERRQELEGGTDEWKTLKSD